MSEDTLYIILILIIVAMITVIMGRKSYKDRKKEAIMEGDDYSLAAGAWENELLYMLKIAKIPVNVNADREELAMAVEKYLYDKIEEKKSKLIIKEGLQNRTLEMYRIFDKAAYSKMMISKTEIEQSAATAQELIRDLYTLQKPLNKLVFRYIKCLYLK